MAKIEYKKEFFDRSYSAGEAYRRVWKYARKYRLRLAVGVICRMATAGTLVPFFQIVQPALQHVESHDSDMEQRQAETVGVQSAAVQPAALIAGSISSSLVCASFICFYPLHFTAECTMMWCV